MKTPLLKLLLISGPCRREEEQDLVEYAMLVPLVAFGATAGA